MDKERLKQLTKMREDIEDLESFLYRIKLKKLLVVRYEAKRMILKCLGYGALAEQILRCDRELTDRIIDTIEQYKAELDQEFEKQ